MDNPGNVQQESGRVKIYDKSLKYFIKLGLHRIF